MSLSKIAAPCEALGMNIDGAAKFDLANVLWDQGEMTASIRMLQQLKGQNDLHKQAIPLSRAELLVTLVSWISLTIFLSKALIISRVTTLLKRVWKSQTRFFKSTSILQSRN
jgi:ataxia telangiectasia mutated family protein